MLKERQKSILDAVVQEYIKTARPVASQSLIQAYGLDVSSATIRNDMQELDDCGYLEQPHTSAGRIPTDKGYRFFVEHILDDEMGLDEDEEEMLEGVFSLRGKQEFLSAFGKAASKLAHAFVFTGMHESDMVFRTGFSEIISEPEFQDQKELCHFGRLLDFLDDEIRPLSQKFLDGKDMMFIGNENPIKNARAYSMAFLPWQHPLGYEGFLTLIGPKRTDYKKQKALTKNIYERRKKTK
ncbi:MAG: DeoR family transcriptional regulator [Candidatus Colwellbacteria bacterium]|nr:DeoR family transcriptional regulator [Candidatus Colwellbacteria bacterium]